MKLLEKYLKALEFGMPTRAIMASSNRGYKQLGVHPSSAIRKANEDEEDEVKEYTSFNPHGSGYGMILQRWNISGSGAKTPNEPIQSASSSQKSVKPKILIKIKKLKKKAKEEKDD